MDLRLDKQVFMVAAASRGLGYGVAQALINEGASISIASRSQVSIHEAQKSLTAASKGRVAAFTFDARSHESIAAWTEGTLTQFGRIDGILVNAGGPPAGTFDSFDDEGWHRGYELVLLSAVRMIRAVLPTMRQQRKGSIVVVTSTSTREPIEGLLLSNVFRAGVANLVKSLSRELASDGIRVNTIAPGRIDTERVQELDSARASSVGSTVSEQRRLQESRIPAGRYGLPAEFGSAAAFLLSDVASYITGTTLVVDGGKTLAL
jgi:3-oxoacyl-[acyl-carrier protein] reductase